MWIELVKDALGLKAGQRVNVDDGDGKHLVDTKAAVPLAVDPTADIVGKALADGMQALTGSLNTAVDNALKQFADVQTKSYRGRKAAFGGGDVDPDAPTFGGFLVAVANNDRKALEAMGSEFCNWRTGVERKAAMTSQTGAYGGFTVPVGFVPRLMMISAENAVVEPRALHIPMDTQEVKIPALNHTTVPTAGETAFFGGVQANWGEEAATLGEEEPTFKQVTLRAHELSGYSLISNTLLDDTGIGLESLLNNLFGRAIGWHKDYAFLRGAGAGRPLGVANWGGTASVTRSAASAFTLVDAANMLGRLLTPDDESKVAWVIHPTVYPKLLTMVSTGVGGDVIYIDNARERPQMMLLGYPVLKTEKMPALNTANDVMLCDFGRYIIGQRQQVEIAYSEHYRFINNQGTWRFVCRVDGRPWLDDDVTLQDATNTLTPFIGLAAG